MPGVRCRTTTTSTPIASMFLAVSMNVSPFDRLLPEAEKSIVSAAQPPGGQRKAGSRAGRGLEEQVGKGLAGQQRQLLLAAGGRFLERHGRVEDDVNLLGRETFQVQQMPPSPSGRDSAKFERGQAH